MALFKKDCGIGLELDAAEVRAVELRGSARQPLYSAWGRVPLPDGAVRDGIVAKSGEVSEALDELWSRSGLGKKEVVLGVANQGVLVRFATFPKVPEEKLGKIIRHQAQDHIPIPLNDVVLDYLVLGEVKEDRGLMLETLLVAARRDMLEGFLEALSGADLRIAAIDVTSLAMLRLLPAELKNGAYAMVDLASGLTNIVVSANGLPRLARQLSTSLSGAMSLLNRPLEDLPYSDDGGDLPEELRGWSQELAGDIRSSISYYQGRSEMPKVDGVLLSGCGSRLAGLVSGLQEFLNLPVRLLQPLEEISVRSREGLIKMAPDFAVAISLARRGLEV